MNDARKFFIISLIIHLLVFIILAYIVLPPADEVIDFLDPLSVEFVELRPVVLKPRPAIEEAEQEEKAEVTPVPEPPKQESFSVSIDTPVSASARTATVERVAKSREMRSMEEVTIKTTPLDLKPIQHTANDTSMAVMPNMQQTEDSIAGDSRGKGYGGFQPQPTSGGSGVKGQSTQFVTPFVLASPQQTGGGKFSSIMPALARGIMERTTQEKLDIVFVVDTTGSMRDNVQGVRNYIHHFLEPMKDEGHDPALGLVQFTDIDVSEAKVMGLTRNEGKFRKWLDKTVFFGGRDIPESGYEALLDALEKIDFRKDTQKFFIFVSDAPQHDLDYDGRSKYTLDRIVSKLNDEGVQMDVIGANFLPVKQLAWGTGGQWKHIPGGNPVSDIPYPNSTMIHSQLEDYLPPVMTEDRVTIKFGERVPDWVDVSYKMLDPMGFKCLGTLTYRKKVLNRANKQMEFVARLDLTKFKDQPGTYTLIYRIRDSIGNWDILRRTLRLRIEDGQETG